MAIQGYHIFIFLVLLDWVTNCTAIEPCNDTASSINRKCFPDSFVFGTASSAYQYEGAAKEGSKGPSIWDTFTHLNGGAKIDDKSNADVTVDSYHRYKEDVALMKGLGFDAYRFSISWSRILPNGKLSGGVNQEGISYYNSLINELLANGIQPFVTLFHWDLPQALQDEYGGLLSRKVVDDYRNYVDICFKEFGDRVKHWITLNEPWTVSINGFTTGNHAPGRCSNRYTCAEGDWGTEPYLASHHQLLAHAAAVQLYKQNYQTTQNGKIGITLISHWFKAFSDSTEDKDATQRALDFMLGWFMDPLTRGDYPESMKSLVADRLPKFSIEESEMVKGSFDFLGLNYYTTQYVYATPKSSVTGYFQDSQAITSNTTVGPQIGKWIAIYPSGLEELLLYVKTKYNHPQPIYITENGLDVYGSLPIEQALADNDRVVYISRHLYYVHKAITNGVNVQGYFAWSLLDNFEWSWGFQDHYGIFYVDFQNGLQRIPKDSARWFKNFLSK